MRDDNEFAAMLRALQRAVKPDGGPEPTYTGQRGAYRLPAVSNAVQPSIGPAPRNLLMEALNRWAPGVHDGVRAAQRELRPKPGPNPFAAMGGLLGLTDGGLGIVEGPALALAAPLGRRALSSDAVRAFAERVKATHGLEKLSLSYKDDVGDLNLDMIQVPKAARGAGVGSRAMEDLIRFSDEYGVRLTLTPESVDGSNPSRLARFYQRFGFMENKGRNKDFRTRERMLRDPR
jgi:GNAT superfamily N-acetyltransferase